MNRCAVRIFIFHVQIRQSLTFQIFVLSSSFKPSPSIQDNKITAKHEKLVKYESPIYPMSKEYDTLFYMAVLLHWRSAIMIVTDVL